MNLNWRGALNGAIDATSGLIEQSRKEDADKRAADLKLETHERLMAIEESFKNRAAEKFSGVARSKMEEQIPVPPEPVTSLSKGSANAIGKQDGMQGNVGSMRAKLNAVLSNPVEMQRLKWTDQQKQQAQELLAQLDAQTGAQKDINAQAVEGKTRSRTLDEAKRAALEETFLNDPSAYMAGKGMLAGDDKADLEERKMAQKDKHEQARLDQKDRSDDNRFEMLMARIEAGFGGGKNNGPTALMQNAEYLKKLGYSTDKIDKFIFEKKEISLEDIATKILAEDKFGEVTPQQAAQKARALRDALQSTPAAPVNAKSADRPPLSSFMKSGAPEKKTPQESSGKIRY